METAGLFSSAALSADATAEVRDVAMVMKPNSQTPPSPTMHVVISVPSRITSPATESMCL